MSSFSKDWVAHAGALSAIWCRGYMAVLYRVLHMQRLTTRDSWCSYPSGTHWATFYINRGTAGCTTRAITMICVQANVADQRGQQRHLGTSASRLIAFSLTSTSTTTTARSKPLREYLTAATQDMRLVPEAAVALAWQAVSASRVDKYVSRLAVAPFGQPAARR